MKRVVDLKNDEELKAASWEAARGAAYGASTWGIGAALASGVAHMYSPIYRGLTVQFRIFLVMSGMVLGGFVEADKRMVAYEKMVRHNNRIRRDAAIWRAYEEEFEAKDAPGAGSDEKVQGKESN
ncbi:uncharacterized protein PV09_00320 [Verruconis gallopava]|uniref:HIG1 domain-containing protein n=1 Tax=Verruconis gallopava TaxID=253628 RepID=A0A0D2ASD9_9PEZI|nr:uncharacterized protein PV09_00320 [Verruconis gallopava]KIW09435.1 hypothetical protein PV09_00320 [Verruconis gallopava]